MDNLPTFAQFTAWGFAGTEEEFSALVNQAAAVVDSCIPVVNEVDASDAEQLEAYQMAVCAVVSFMREGPAQGVRAYTAGKVHEEFAEAQTAADVARRYLCGSGLLSMWA